MIVVTGGAGFIGSNVVAALNARGRHDVVAVDRLGGDDKWRNLQKRELADLVAPEDLQAFLAARGGKVEAIVHMGAISATTERDADLILRNNFRLSLDLWTWCAETGARFIYASSAATYGDGAQGFLDDESPDALAALRPLNPYGWSKHLFDRRVARLAQEKAARPPQWAGLKFFNVYGPNEYHKGEMRSWLAKTCAMAAAGTPVQLFRSHRPDYPDGGQQRDFVHVDDCVAVVLWLLDRPQANGLFNVGSGAARSWLDLAHALFAALAREPRIEFVPMPQELQGRYQYFTQAEMGKLRQAGYGSPFRELEDGVASYVRDFLSAPDPYR
jgi:ADP-L-glycero-D-manno-heptose 6-epimerase